MANHTGLRKVIDRILKKEEDEFGPQDLFGEGVLLSWKSRAYDATEYGTQDSERKHRPGVDDDLEGWEVVR